METGLTPAIVPGDVLVDLTELSDDETASVDVAAHADRFRSPPPCPPPAPRLSPCSVIESEPALHFLGGWVGEHAGNPADPQCQDVADIARVLRLDGPGVVERGVDGLGMLSVPALQALLGDGEALPETLSSETLSDLSETLSSSPEADPWERACTAASMPPLTLGELEAMAPPDPEGTTSAESEEQSSDSDSDYSLSDAEPDSDSETETEETPADLKTAKDYGPTETDDEGARVYREVERVFEPVEGGAITGHLTRPSVDRLFRALGGMPPPYAMVRDSVFLDLGSGMGYLTMYALLFCDRALGVEFAPLIHAQSAVALRNIIPTLDFCKRAAVVRGDILAMESLCRPVPATHVHTFAFSLDVLRHIVDLLVRGSARPRCVSIIPRSAHELVEVGLLPPDGPTRDARRAERVLHSFTVTMPSGDRHTCWVFAITDELVEACRARARPAEADAPAASVKASVMRGMMQLARTRLYDDDDLEFRDAVEAVDPVALCSSRPTKRRRKNIGSASTSL